PPSSPSYTLSLHDALPIFAALLAVQRGLEVHVLDRATSGIKPELVHALGVTYHTGSANDLGFEPDVVLECTGAPAVVMEVIGRKDRKSTRLNSSHDQISYA